MSLLQKVSLLNEIKCLADASVNSHYLFGCSVASAVKSVWEIFEGQTVIQSAFLWRTRPHLISSSFFYIIICPKKLILFFFFRPPPAFFMLVILILLDPSGPLWPQSQDTCGLFTPPALTLMWREPLTMVDLWALKTQSGCVDGLMSDCVSAVCLRSVLTGS